MALVKTSETTAKSTNPDTAGTLLNKLVRKLEKQKYAIVECAVKRVDEFFYPFDIATGQTTDGDLEVKTLWYGEVIFMCDEDEIDPMFILHD